MSYFFFFSYARKEFERDKLLRQFYEDLENRIFLLRPPEEGEKVGFRDEVGIPVGEIWHEALENALKTTRVFIYIYSPHYFNSWWCEWEWFVFQKRLEKYQEQYGRRPPLMLPVLWEPDCKNAPPCATSLEFSYEVFGEVYKQKGLRFIMSRKKHAYQPFLDDFAKMIVHTVEQQQYELCQLDQLPSLEETQNLFCRKLASGASVSRSDHKPHEAGPGYAKFVYIAGHSDEMQTVRNDVGAYGKKGGGDWKPYFPECDDEIYKISMKIVRRETSFEFNYLRDLSNDVLLEEIKDCKTKNVVVLLIDPWTLKLQHYAEVMGKYDQDIGNSAVLILFNAKNEETCNHLSILKDVVKTKFPSKISDKSSDMFRDHITSLEELESELSVALHKIRIKIIQTSPSVRKVPGEGYSSLPMLQNNSLG